jgi:hypothetical protein
VGAEFELPWWELVGRVTGFYNQLSQLPRPTQEAVARSDGQGVRGVGLRSDGEGRAYGLEVQLRRRLQRGIFGWVSYTLSRSERQDLPSEPSRRSQFDQTNILTLIGNYKLGKGWQLGVRFRLTSGDLYTTTSTGAYNASVGSQLGVAAFPPYDARLPLFHQLDVRIERLRVYRYSRWTWFVDLQNAYFKNNPLGVAYNYNYTQRAFLNGLPILPIFGARVEW